MGKTTLARILAERLHARRIYDCEDNPFLADFYNAKSGAAFRAQMYFLIERQRRIREAFAAPAGEAPGPVISDFLMEKDRIFANLNLDDEELKLYERYYESLTAELPAPDLVIYLQAKPEVLRSRIANFTGIRGRSGTSLRTLFFPLRRRRSAGDQHIRNRFRRAQRRSAAAPAPASGTREGHPVFPSPWLRRVAGSAPCAFLKGCERGNSATVAPANAPRGLAWLRRSNTRLFESVRA